MLRKKQWDWDKAVEGMQVFLVDTNNIKLVISGIVREVKRSDKCQMIDGKPVKSPQVASVTISCEDNLEVILTRDNPQYQIILK